MKRIKRLMIWQYYYDILVPSARVKWLDPVLRYQLFRIHFTDPKFLITILIREKQIYFFCTFPVIGTKTTSVIVLTSTLPAFLLT